MPYTARSDLAAATVTNAAGQSLLYAIGGRLATGGALDRVQAYNVATNSWIWRAPLPVPLYQTNGAGVINGKIYISGGYSDIDARYPRGNLYVYDPTRNVWTEKRGMPDIGVSGVTGVIGGQLYVLSRCFEDFGGPDYFRCQWPAANFYRYNPVTNRWAVLPPPPLDAASYSGGMGAVIGAKFYAMGAYGAAGRLVVYDPATNRWSARTPLPQARSNAAAAVIGSKLYVIGGVRFTSGGVDTLRATSVYDPTTDAWTTRTSLPTARAGIAASKVFLNGKARIEVVGGSRPGNNLAYLP